MISKQINLTYLTYIFSPNGYYYSRSRVPESNDTEEIIHSLPEIKKWSLTNLVSYSKHLWGKGCIFPLLRIKSEYPKPR